MFQKRHPISPIYLQLQTFIENKFRHFDQNKKILSYFIQLLFIAKSISVYSINYTVLYQFLHSLQQKNLFSSTPSVCISDKRHIQKRSLDKTYKFAQILANLMYPIGSAIASPPRNFTKASSENVQYKMALQVNTNHKIVKGTNETRGKPS